MSADFLTDSDRSKSRGFQRLNTDESSISYFDSLNPKDQIRTSESSLSLSSDGQSSIRSSDSRNSFRQSLVNPPHTLHPSGTLFRCLVLSTVAFILMAGYFSDEVIGATATELRLQMRLSPKEIGWIYSASYGPNIIMIFIGGILVDKFGVKLMGTIYTFLVVAGLAMFALIPTLWGRILARIVFGMGFEPLEVCSDAIVMRWYSSSRVSSRDGSTKYRVGIPSIPLAFSVLFSTGIFGQFLSLNVLPSILTALKNDLTKLYLIVTALGVVAFFVCIIYCILDFIGSRKLDLEHAAHESISFRTLTQFPLSYWIIMGVCVFGYSCQYVFMIYASDYINEKWDYDPIKAGHWASTIYIFAIIFSPVIGIFIERRGQGLTLMALGCFCFCVGCIVMALIPNSYLPLIPLILMGIAYSCVPATVWSSISDVIPDHLAGTGFGVMTAIMSFTYLVIPSAVGGIHDIFGSYNYMNYLFAACSLLSFLGVYWLFKLDPELNIPPRLRRRNLAIYENISDDTNPEVQDEDEDDSGILDVGVNDNEKKSKVKFLDTDKTPIVVSRSKTSDAVRSPLISASLPNNKWNPNLFSSSANRPTRIESELLTMDEDEISIEESDREDAELLAAPRPRIRD